MADAPENLLIPAEFYFQPTFEIPFRAKLRDELAAQKIPAGLSELPELRFLPGTQGAGSDAPRISLAWNDDGLAVEILFSRAEPLQPYGKSQAQGVVHLYLDTRDIKTNHRPTRFCSLFHIQPDLSQGQGYKLQQIDLVPDPRSERIRSLTENLSVHRDKQQTRLLCWLDASQLFGFDPENVPSLGFFYYIVDPKTGTFGWGDTSFPFTTDPSLWGSLKLVR